MIISHEIPKQLFPFHDLISDYPYALGHLLDKDKQYSDFYLKKFSQSKFSILDNSAFELGESIDSEEYLTKIKKYKPSHFILPDKLHDMKATIQMSSVFMSKIDNSCGYPIGVLQGHTFQELIACYSIYIGMGVRYIAIPFDCIKDSDWNTVRYLFFKEFIRCEGRHVQNNAVCIHFLGLQNPSELLLYGEELKYITSIDTSSPIVNGWSGNLFNNYGNPHQKPSVKLADSMDIVLTDNNIEDIIHNINKFRSYVNR